MSNIKIMSQQKTNFIQAGLRKITEGSGFINRKPEQAIKSLKSISQVIYIFGIFFLLAFAYKLIIVSTGINHFKTLLTSIDILPLYAMNGVHFFCLAGYDILKLVIIILTFFYFTKFLGSIEISDLFGNLKSRNLILYVAALSIAFFMVDVISILHLSYVEDILKLKNHIRLFNFEYLMLAYFINVFAFIFKRGVDLKNEIDLVI